MVEIAMFGASGKTGRRVLARALEAGHTVRALARDPSTLPESGPHLSVVGGDVMDADAVDRTVAGSEAVLSLFGHVKGSARDLQTQGTKHIVAAMRRHGVGRLITLSGGGLRAPQDRPKIPDRMIRGLLKLVAGHVLADAEGHLGVLQESGLDWTVVRAPMLTETPGRGQYRVGWVGVETSTRISRDDLADFILTQVSDRSFVGQLPFVSD